MPAGIGRDAAGDAANRAAGGLPGVPTLPTFTAASRVPPGRAPQAATGGDAPSTPEEQTSAGFLGQPGGRRPPPAARPGSLGS